MHRLAVTLSVFLSVVLCLGLFFAPPARMAVLRAGHATAAAPWQTIAAQKRQRDMAKIPPEWRLAQDILDQAKLRRSIADEFIDSLLDSDSRSLTNLDAPALMAMTANGSLTAVRLTTAFCKRAAYAHQLNQNLLQIGFDDAVERAKTLDVFWGKHQRPVGPLHGLPITMKDQFHVKGMGTTMGYVGWIDSF